MEECWLHEFQKLAILGIGHYGIAEDATFCRYVYTDPGLKLNIWAIKAK